MAHAADAPHLAGDRTESSPDFDAVTVEQEATNSGLVEACGEAALGDPHRREFGEAVALLGEQLESHLLESLLEPGAAGLVTGLGVLEALVQDHAEAGV